jgi:hypothetical protein
VPRPYADMQTVRFYPDQGGPATLHVELPGGIVNIRVGLTDADGAAVNAVEIIASDERRGGDGEGRVWHLADDGYRLVVVAGPEDTQQPNAVAEETGDDESGDEPAASGRWSLVTTVEPTDDETESIAEQIRYGSTHGSIDRP